MRTPIQLAILVSVALLAYRFSNVAPSKTNDKQGGFKVTAPVLKDEEQARNQRSNSLEKPLLLRPPVSPDVTAEETSDLDPVHNSPDRVTLRLNVSNLKPQESKLHIAFFTSAKGFPKSEQSTQSETIPINESTASQEFYFEKMNSVAVAIFQDLDGNGILSKGAYGIPNEPYGFSNNARGLMGPPTFKQAEIQIQKPEQVVEIHLK